MVTLDPGIDARASAMIVKVASRKLSKVDLTCENECVNARSVMGVMMLVAGKGNIIRVDAVGEDAKEAVQEIGDLIKSDFGWVGKQKKEEAERALDDAKGGSEAKRKSDEEWLRSPSIPGFSTDALKAQNIERILIWMSGWCGPLSTDTIEDVFEQAELRTYRCPLHRIHVDRLQSGYYAVLVTDCINDSFIRAIHARDSKLQIVLYAVSDYIKLAAKEHLEGLHVSAVVDTSSSPSTLLAAVRDVGLPRYRSNIIPNDEEGVMFFSEAVAP